jgi:membrane fusion protein, heavy metal efflux system
MTSRLSSWCGAVALLIAACSKPDVPRQDAAKPDTAMKMADMPAMSVTLSAVQIAHGGVKWGPVAMGTASGAAVIPGEVLPNEDRTARLGAPARGRILGVPVRPGDRVTVGQVLVTMQSPEAGMAQSDVSKAEAELAARRAEAQYAAGARARADRLLALKSIPRQDYERAISDDEHARASVAQAEAELRRARATADQLSAGASASGEVTLRAPSAGVVLSRTAVPGTVVEAGAPLVVVTDPSQLWLTISAPEQLSALFHRGGRVRFVVPAYPADTFAARVDAVGAGLEPETRTLSVRGVVVNGDGRLKPQMLANAIVEGAGSSAAAFVPDDAVQLVQGKPNVFVARPDNKGGATFERREVTVGTRSGGRVAVLRGLAAGDVIVVAGAFAVKAELQKSGMPKMEM